MDADGDLVGVEGDPDPVDVEGDLDFVDVVGEPDFVDAVEDFEASADELDGLAGDPGLENVADLENDVALDFPYAWETHELVVAFEGVILV